MAIMRRKVSEIDLTVLSLIFELKVRGVENFE
jgi:hypothetical protein